MRKKLYAVLILLVFASNLAITQVGPGPGYEVEIISGQCSDVPLGICEK